MGLIHHTEASVRNCGLPPKSTSIGEAAGEAGERAAAQAPKQGNLPVKYTWWRRLGGISRGLGRATAGWTCGLGGMPKL